MVRAEIAWMLRNGTQEFHTFWLPTCHERQNKDLNTHLLIPGPDFAVEVQGFLGLLKLPAMQQIGTNHDPRATFACLAVDGGHMIVVFAQPLVEVLAERLDQLQLRGVVVFKGVLCNWRKNKRLNRSGSPVNGMGINGNWTDHHGLPCA